MSLLLLLLLLLVLLSGRHAAQPLAVYIVTWQVDHVNRRAAVVKVEVDVDVVVVGTAMEAVAVPGHPAVDALVLVSEVLVEVPVQDGVEAGVGSALVSVL